MLGQALPDARRIVDDVLEWRRVHDPEPEMVGVRQPVFQETPILVPIGSEFSNAQERDVLDSRRKGARMARLVRASRQGLEVVLLPIEIHDRDLAWRRIIGIRAHPLAEKLGLDERVLDRPKWVLESRDEWTTRAGRHSAGPNAP